MQSKERYNVIEEKHKIHQSQLASVGQMAAGIAHEIRNPLTAVKGFLQLMKEKPEEKYIDIAQSELNNALLTLDNLLQVSKPGLEDEPYQSICLAIELESILQLFQDQVYRVNINMDFQNTDCYIFGKRNQFKKAFFNLLKNAFEAIPGEGAITITHSATDSSVIVQIVDNGSGIPEEKLQLIGTPFFTTKAEGTGMGLAQVFSVVYQHGGNIKVDSEQMVGTTFTITIPRQLEKTNHGVTELTLNYIEGCNLKEFFEENKQKFKEQVLNYAVTAKEKIEEIQAVGRINLMDNAHRLVHLLIDGREHEIVSFAKEEGKIWAKHTLTLAFKLEWIQAIRRAVWDFIYNYDRLSGAKPDTDLFYSQEKTINTMIDQFLNYFFISYSRFKDELIHSQREMVEDLSVPIIPLTDSISILPLIGTVDTFRGNMIVDKVITQIGLNRIQTLIIDLSGVVLMDTGVVYHLIKVVDGITLMGCKTVITGIRPEIVKTLIKLDVSFKEKVETKGTLQQALATYIEARK